MELPYLNTVRRDIHIHLGHCELALRTGALVARVAAAIFPQPAERVAIGGARPPRHVDLLPAMVSDNVVDVRCTAVRFVWLNCCGG